MTEENVAQMIGELYESCPEGRQKYTKYSKKLKKQFSDKNLDEIPIGKVEKEKNKLGSFLTIKNEKKIEEIPEHKSKEPSYDCLRALKGIGPVTENKLKEKGFKNLKKLTNHEKWGKKAEKFLTTIQNYKDCHIGQYQNNLEEKIQGNDWTVFDLHKNYKLKEFVTLDIETLGLSNVPLFLIGLAEINEKKNKVEVTQYLARNFEEEKNIILKTRKHLQNRPLITFNGKKFDIPYIKRRALHHNIKTNINKNLNLDVLKFAKKTWKEQFTNFKLETIEKRYGIQRKGDIPSKKVPDYYTEYTRSKNIGTLIPILEHNIQDVISTSRIFLDLIRTR